MAALKRSGSSVLKIMTMTISLVGLIVSFSSYQNRIKTVVDEIGFNQQNSRTSINKSRNLILQIGFNKCGTETLWDFFNRNNISAAHATGLINGTQHMIGKYLFEKYQNNSSVIVSDFINKYSYFGDFGVFVQQKQTEDILFADSNYIEHGKYRTWYEIINNKLSQYNEYNILYILNLRPVNKWLKSRYLHHWHGHDLITFAKRIMQRKYGKHYESADVLKDWKVMWYEYMCNLLMYFEDDNMMDWLLIFDIEYDNIDKLISFFDEHNVHLNKKYYIWEHASKRTHPRLYKNWLNNWKDIVLTNPDLIYNYSYYSNGLDSIDNEYEMINHICSTMQTNNISIGEYLF